MSELTQGHVKALLSAIRLSNCTPLLDRRETTDPHEQERREAFEQMITALRALSGNELEALGLIKYGPPQGWCEHCHMPIKADLRPRRDCLSCRFFTLTRIKDGRKGGTCSNVVGYAKETMADDSCPSWSQDDGFSQ